MPIIYKALFIKTLLNVVIFQSSKEDSLYLHGVYIIRKHKSHHKGHNMSLLGFYCCGKTPIKNNLGRKGVICLVGFSPSSSKARAGNHSRNQEATDHGGILTDWLVPCSQFALLYYSDPSAYIWH